jgi:hypothetical protein
MDGRPARPHLERAHPRRDQSFADPRQAVVRPLRAACAVVQVGGITSFGRVLHLFRFDGHFLWSPTYPVGSAISEILI